VFWVPEKPPEAGQELNFHYTINWRSEKSNDLPYAYVVDTRLIHQGDGAKFLIDFQGQKINAMPPEQALTADISISKGYRVVEQQVFKNTVTGGWRLVFQIKLDKDNPLKDAILNKSSAVDLRAYLKNGSDALTETWNYAYTP
jgi:glucans biosynthesis protein